MERPHFGIFFGKISRKNNVIFFIYLIYANILNPICILWQEKKFKFVKNLSFGAFSPKSA
jgi:hypothetical protein